MSKYSLKVVYCGIAWLLLGILFINGYILQELGYIFGFLGIALVHIACFRKEDNDEE